MLERNAMIWILQKNYNRLEIIIHLHWKRLLLNRIRQWEGQGIRDHQCLWYLGRVNQDLQRVLIQLDSHSYYQMNNNNSKQQLNQIRNKSKYQKKRRKLMKENNKLILNRIQIKSTLGMRDQLLKHLLQHKILMLKIKMNLFKNKKIKKKIFRLILKKKMYFKQLKKEVLEGFPLLCLMIQTNP